MIVRPPYELLICRRRASLHDARDAVRAALGGPRASLSVVPAIYMFVSHYNVLQ